MTSGSKMSVTELFAKRLSGEVKFVPKRVYDPKGDCVTYFHEDVSTSSKQLDPFITLYYEPVSGRLVGFKVKCVRMIVEKIIEEMGRDPSGITFNDVLEVAGKMSEDHRRRQHRENAQRSALAEITLPELS